MLIDRIIGAIMLALAAGYLLATTQIPSLEIGDPLGPKAFPVLLGIALIAATILLFVETMKPRPRDAAAPATLRENRRHLLLLGGVTMWTAFYFGLFDRAGYLLSTAVYLFALMATFNRDKWLANALTAVLFTIGSFVLFDKILGVSLPAGVLHF